MNYRMNAIEPDSTDPIIGSRLFTDGVTRDVFQAVDGRQYVVEPDELIYGTFLNPDTAGIDVPILRPSPSSGE